MEYKPLTIQSSSHFNTPRALDKQFNSAKLKIKNDIQDADLDDFTLVYKSSVANYTKNHLYCQLNQSGIILGLLFDGFGKSKTIINNLSLSDPIKKHLQNVLDLCDNANGDPELLVCDLSFEKYIVGIDNQGFKIKKTLKNDREFNLETDEQETEFDDDKKIRIYPEVIHIAHLLGAICCDAVFNIPSVVQDSEFSFDAIVECPDLTNFARLGLIAMGVGKVEAPHLKFIFNLCDTKFFVPKNIRLALACGDALLSQVNDQGSDVKTRLVREKVSINEDKTIVSFVDAGGVRSTIPISKKFVFTSKMRSRVSKFEEFNMSSLSFSLTQAS